MGTQIVLVVVVIAIVVAIAGYFAKKRSQALEKAAIQMGFTFERQGKPFLGELDKNLHLLQQGSVKSLNNLMRGPNGLSLFDYQFQRAGIDAYNRNNRTINQTVAALHVSSPLPVFYLGPEKLWQKAASALGYHMIGFDSHPQFAKRFCLRGPDESGIRQFFAPALLEYCQSWPEKPVWCVEAAGPWLLLYRPGKKTQPADMATFADSVTAMFKEITNRAGVHA